MGLAPPGNPGFATVHDKISVNWLRSPLRTMVQDWNVSAPRDSRSSRE